MEIKYNKKDESNKHQKKKSKAIRVRKLKLTKFKPNNLEIEKYNFFSSN